VYCIVLSCVALYHTATSYKPTGNETTTTAAAAAAMKTTTTTQFTHKAQGNASTVTGQLKAPHLLLNTITHSLPSVTHKVGAIRGAVGKRLAHKKDVMKSIQIVCVMCIVLTLE
jgi:hypothetical protein